MKVQWWMVQSLLLGAIGIATWVAAIFVVVHFVVKYW